MQLLVHLWIPTLFLLKLCSAEDIPCTCTQVGGETRCSVPEFNAPNCPYQWCNGSKYVMANQDGAVARVLEKSNRTLVTRGCSPPIHYSYNCFAEGRKLEATCNFNCSTEASPPKEDDLPNWVVPVSASVVLLVLLVLCIYGIISCKKKYKRSLTTDKGSSDDEDVSRKLCCCSGTIIQLQEE